MGMILSSQNDKTLMRLMSAATKRSTVIASNLSNINTPGYKRRELRFEDSLISALAQGRQDSVQPEIVIDTETPGMPNGNNVSLEEELMAGEANVLMYQTYATILDGHYRMIGSAIQGGR